MRKVIVVILAVLTLVVGMTVPAFADTTKTVVITADPAYIVITQAVGTWTLNGIVGDGVTPKGYIAVDTIYYANPLGDELAPAADIIVDAECYFDLVSTGSSLNLDLAVNCGSFTGGGAAMANTDTDGSNGAATYGAFVWASGGNYTITGVGNKVIMKSSGSLAIKEDLAPSASFRWGAQIETRTNVWATSGASTANMVLTATAHPD